jgi:SulP family sulfate permease
MLITRIRQDWFSNIRGDMLAGGRPGMISAATGAMALVMVTLVKDHGLQYLLAATILTGVLQIIAGAYGHSRIRQLLVRSTATTMLRTLSVPILLLR